MLSIVDSERGSISQGTQKGKKNNSFFIVNSAYVVCSDKKSSKSPCRNLLRFNDCKPPLIEKRQKNVLSLKIKLRTSNIDNHRKILTTDDTCTYKMQNLFSNSQKFAFDLSSTFSSSKSKFFSKRLCPISFGR